MEAKVGDVMTEKAARRGARCTHPHNPFATVADRTVVAKIAGSTQGRWICIDCGELPVNNLEANCHEAEKPKHRLAWRGHTGRLEEP